MKFSEFRREVTPERRERIDTIKAEMEEDEVRRPNDPFFVVIVHAKPGGHLPNGTPNGKGGEATYQVAMTTNGIDRQPLGPIFATPKEAYRHADELEQAEKESWV